MDNFLVDFLQNDVCVPESRGPEPAFIRVLHAAPQTSPVNVYANGKLLISNLAYKEISPYINVPAGTYNIKVYPACGPAITLVNKDITVIPGHKYTFAAVGEAFNIRLLVIPDLRIPPPPGQANVRFAHLSPNAPAVDITLPNGVLLFENVSFKQVTSYISVPPGVYTLQVRATGTDIVVLTIKCIEFETGINYTLYAVGLLEEKPGLQVLVTPNQGGCCDESCCSPC